MAGATFDLVTIDAVDAQTLADFWAAALELVELEREDNGRWIVLGSRSIEHTAVTNDPTVLDPTNLDYLDPTVLDQLDRLGDQPVRTVRRIGIQRIPDLALRSAVWAGDSKARLHLDLRCDLAEFDNEVERLIALGATELRPRRVETYGSISTLTDPEGNVFDLCAYKASPRA